MTALEAYELTTHGGGTDFALLIEACESIGDYCLIGGLAVNTYVEPVYTVDVHIVLGQEPSLANTRRSQTQLRIQFTTDARYQSFVNRAREADMLGVRVRVASLEDVTQGKLWAYSDPQRRLSKRKKDELDLIRLAEAYPALKSMYPPELRDIIDRG